MFEPSRDKSNEPQPGEGAPDPRRGPPFAGDLADLTMPGRPARPEESRQPEPEPPKRPDPSALPLPPRVPGSFFGQLNRLRADFLGYLCESAKLGDVVRLHPLPWSDIYLVSHPALVRRVLAQDADLYEKSGQTRKMVGKFLGEGLVLSEGESHAAQRKIMQPAFAPRRVGLQAETIRECASEAVDRWLTSGSVDFRSELKQLTLDVAQRAFFGVRSGDESSEIVRAMQTFEGTISGRFRSIPFPDWIPTRANREQRKAIALMDRAVGDLIDSRLSATPDPAKPGNALDGLIAAHRSGLMDRKGVRDQLVTLFFAGHETIANLLLWAVYEIAARPGLQASIAGEGAKALGSRPLAPALESMQATTDALKEVLRLYPSAWVFDRSPVSDVELGGFRIPKGSTVFVSPLVTQRDPRWFERPLEFDSSRFTPAPDGSKLEDRLPKLAYFPFGAGPRFCIGYAMAMLEARVVLAELFSRCEVTISGPSTPRLDPSATLGMKDALFGEVRARAVAAGGLKL